LPGNNLLFEKKKLKDNFSFQSMPNLDFAEDFKHLKTPQQTKNRIFPPC
jgi:hypothetical protein